MVHDIALFFDNEDKNLKNARDSCPNVIPIKVPDTTPFSFSPNTVMNNCIAHYNTLDEGARRFYACLITTLRQEIKGVRSVDQIIEGFDVAAGVYEKMMLNVVAAMNDPKFTANYNITACIFDIDRTIIKNEGFLDTPHIKSFDAIIKAVDVAAAKQSAVAGIDFSVDLASVADLNNLSLNTDLKAEKDKITIQDVAHCFLGGVDRTVALKQFFDELRARNVDVIFLTNNQSYCTSNLAMKRCPSKIDLAEPVTNTNYNWLFYDMLTGVGIVTADKDYFIKHMMIYNNNGSIDAALKGAFKYNRISNMMLLNDDGTMTDHKLKLACKDTLGADMDRVSDEVKNVVVNGVMPGGAKKKTRLRRRKGGKKKRQTRRKLKK